METFILKLLNEHKTPVFETTSIGKRYFANFNFNSRSVGYRQLLKTLHRMETHKQVGHITIKNHHIWWSIKRVH